jgi:predicted permease
VVLLTSAGLLLRTLTGLQAADPGFQTRDVLLTRLMPRPGGYDRWQPDVYYRDLLVSVQSLPGVQAVSLSRDRPGNSYASRETLGGVAVERWPVSPGFFETVRMRLLGGRDFHWSDQEGTPRVGIVSRNLAERMFPGIDPIGQRIRAMNDSVDVEIVGVVENAQVSNLRLPPPYVLFLPVAQQPQFRQGILLIRTTDDSAALRAAISAAIDASNREFAHRIHTLDEAVGQGLVAERLAARLAAFFAILALLLGAIGLYALISYSMARKTHEIGIRLALGAERRAIVLAAIRGGLTLTVLGIAFGVPLSLATTGLLSGMLIEIGPRDPVTLAAVAGVLLMTGGLAALIPARRAARVDPMVALRCE